MISVSKWVQLRRDMQLLGVDEVDLQEKFILGSGAGGQKVNKSNTCVYLKHLPTAIEVKCQDRRSQEDNRYFARRRLCEKISQKRDDVMSEKQQKIAKLKRQKRRRSRRAQEKVLADKQHQSRVKKSRKSPDGDA